uniref:Vinculin n=1 Tax=Timema douglasi TaxID=61478 RepID=A0A7R8VDM5_TIMDO|nr:unnamed protein product [Timema douglasi]
MKIGLYVCSPYSSLVCNCVCVFLQVSRLVILHEEAEDGNAMPDLERPVMAVSRAVTNLVKVGRETINSSDDAILKQDMPSALVRVEGASKFLEEASGMLKVDPYSGPARSAKLNSGDNVSLVSRKKLIEGSRGILQGTSSLLLCFDESEVRKIIRECKRVLDYLAVAEVIETMEDLVQFLKDLSPCLSKVSREVTAREKELTHQVHREILVRCLEQVKTLAPILICSMKIFIHIIGQGGKGVDEAAENRNYLSQRMTDEINEIIRVLQLTTYDEEEWDADNLTVMKKSYNAIEGKIRTAHDWLEDPLALRGGVGEKSVRQILDHAYKVAERSLPHDADTIRKQCSDITTMTDALSMVLSQCVAFYFQAEALSRGIQDKLRDLYTIVNRAVQGVEKSGIQQPAHTVSGRLEQARRWLDNPDRDDKGLGQQAIALIVHEGKKVAEGLPGVHRAEILGLCDEVDILSRQLSDLCRRGHGNSPQAQDIARNLSQRLYDLKDRIQNAVVNRVVEDFIDISTPLKQFTDAVHVPEGTPGREQNFGDKAQQLQHFSTRASKTARMVAAGGSGGNKKLAEALLTSSSQVESLTPQLISAGRIRMNYPESKAADEHFQNLVSQYSDSILRVRSLCDEATESADFIKMSEEQIQKHTILCEESIRKSQPQKMVDNTSSIARLANRVLMVAKQESDNSEDPKFISRVNQASDSLQTCVTPMVQDAKSVAMNMQDHVAISHWKESNRALLSAVSEVRRAVTVTPDLPPPPDMANLHINDDNNVEQYQPSQRYNYFTEKVGQSMRGQPGPGPSPGGTLSPTLGHKSPTMRAVSPLPKWARGDNADLLYHELTSDDDHVDRVERLQSHDLMLTVCATDYAPPRPPLPGGEMAPPRPPPPETDDEDDMFLQAPLPKPTYHGEPTNFLTILAAG